jgi:hypothetical protein
MAMKDTLKKLAKIDMTGNKGISEDGDVMALAPSSNQKKRVKGNFQKSKLEAKEEMEQLLAVSPK